MKSLSSRGPSSDAALPYLMNMFSMYQCTIPLSGCWMFSIYLEKNDKNLRGFIIYVANYSQSCCPVTQRANVRLSTVTLILWNMGSPSFLFIVGYYFFLLSVLWCLRGKQLASLQITGWKLARQAMLPVFRVLCAPVSKHIIVPNATYTFHFVAQITLAYCYLKKWLFLKKCAHC